MSSSEYAQKLSRFLLFLADQPCSFGSNVTEEMREDVEALAVAIAAGTLNIAEVRRQASARAKENPENVLESINAIIQTQTRYGYRIWKNAGRGTLLRWSNSVAGWRVWGSAAQGSRVFLPPDLDFKKLRLDADMILVPYSRVVILPILHQLKPLPLYQNSHEGKKRSIS